MKFQIGQKVRIRRERASIFLEELTNMVGIIYGIDNEYLMYWWVWFPEHSYNGAVRKSYGDIRDVSFSIYQADLESVE